MSLFEVLYETIEEDSGEDLASYGLQRYTPVIVAGLAVTFRVVKVYNGGVLEVLRHDAILPYGLEDVYRFLGEDRTS